MEAREWKIYPQSRPQYNFNVIIIIIMTLFKCQMYLARTALIGDTFQIELEFRNVSQAFVTI